MTPDPALFGMIQPIHLMYIASSLEKAGHKVIIFDTNIEKSKRKFIKNLKKFKPDVVGISAVSATIYSAWETAEVVKANSKAIVIMGGDHVTFLPGETLECCEYVDFVIRGEGEVTTVELLEYINESKPIDNIKGISYIKDGEIVHNPPRNWIQNLDDLPYPSWHLVDMYKYVQMVGRSGLFVSSRGCNRGCSFCISSRKLGLNWRARSAKSVVNEMITLIERYPKLDNLVSIDDNFMWDIERVEKICDLLIQNNFKKPWICQGRADTIVKGGVKLAEKMKKAGCMAIQIGVESPDKKRLEAISKGITKNEALEAVRIVQSAGIAVRATYLFGFEGETKEKMRQTYDFAKDVVDAEAVQFTIITPFPGAPYFEKMKHKVNTHDWRRFTVSHQTLDYSFDVEKELSKFYLKYHLRPKFLKTASDMNIKQFTTIISFISPIVKSILGVKGNFLFDFTDNKWVNKNQKYWEKYILKTDLTYEKNWFFDKPQIEKMDIIPEREKYQYEKTEDINLKNKEITVSV